MDNNYNNYNNNQGGYPYNGQGNQYAQNGQGNQYAPNGQQGGYQNQQGNNGGVMNGMNRPVNRLSNGNYQQQGNMYGGMNGQYSPMMSVPPPKKNKSMIILIIIIIVLILAIIGVVAFIFLKDDDSGNTGRKKSSSSASVSETAETSTDESSETDSEDTEDSGDSAVELVSTPNVTGLTLADAETALTQNGFSINTTQEYNDSYPADCVISQNIAAGTSVAKGTMISLVVSLGTQPVQQVTVPNVKGISITDATSQLSGLGLIVSTSYAYSNSTVDYVTEQSVAPNTVVTAGTTVTLTVSMGPAPTQMSPDKLYGKVITRTDDLNVRESASINAKILGTVEKGSTVEIIGQEGNWYKIAYKNGYGFVAMDFVSIIN